MTSLEMRYRRLLAAYPAAHRQDYEEEMVGVLMEGARPDQDRPSLGETLDLLWSGLLERGARGARGGKGLLSAGWRDATAVAGLLGALLLMSVAVRRLVLSFLGNGFVLEPGLPGAAIRAAVWLAVVVVALAGLRRTTALLAGAGLVAEAVTFAGQVPGFGSRTLTMAWSVLLAAGIAALLRAARQARPATAVLGWAGTVLLTGPFLLGFASGYIAVRLSDSGVSGWLEWTQILGLISVRDALVITAVALALAGVLRAAPGTRGRILVLSTPIVTAPAAASMSFSNGPSAFGDQVPATTLDAILLTVGLPLLTLLVAAAVLWVRENLAVALRRKQV